MNKRFLLTAAIFYFISCSTPLPSYSDQNADSIRINQLGYYPDSPKIAVIVDAVEFENFKVVSKDGMETVLKGKLSDPIQWDLAGESVKLADFSDLKKAGSYTIYVEGLGYSYPFDIAPNVLEEAFKASVKSLYYQRASTALPEQYAGQWQRNAGHADDSVVFHPSSGRSGIGAFPKGWYDAGDYGKYVVNGALSLGQIMALYEQYPNALEDGSLHIPESGNGIPDILDELKYEMDWLLSMQDEDGGVFFKLTTESFEGMVLPELATKTRNIYGKSTTASLDLAAVAAKAYRVFKEYDSLYSAQSLEAAKKAWVWAKENPDIAYKNPENVITGEYGDTNFSQEFYWAASELYLSTGSEEYSTYLQDNPIDFEFVPGESWANFMHYLGAFALIDNLEEGDPFYQESKKSIIADADVLLDRMKGNDYRQPIDDFQWGSNSDVFNSAMILAQAYRITKNKTYLDGVLETTDYIFGKNATGYSFLTGYGSRTPMFIHHRPSAGDAREEPVPGLVSGGPNSRRQDESDVTYPDNPAPMKSWVDQEPSFASNEICLNWNSAAIYVLGFLEQEMAAKE